MILAAITSILSEVGRNHPDLVSDEKVRRYILLIVEEARKLPRHGHDETDGYTVEESVELARCRREGKEQPPHSNQATVRAWLVEQRLRWAKERHPDYRDLLPKE
jgi:hypothetical protein